jgi:excinuclease UvrABC nuclease subunit
MRRLLDPPEAQSKRLNLRDRVARIEYCSTGSEFESSLVLYDAAVALFGYGEARRRLKLHTPYFLRMRMENAFPRVYVTNKLSKRGLAEMYGPFPSRAAAERYCDAALDLFKLRRCYEDLEPYPEHPGCVYGEMKKCLEPCKQACSAEEYAAEAATVKRFFDTHGGSLMDAIGLEREEAASAMKFEEAAVLHERWHKVKAAAALADELVQPVPRLRAVIVQEAASSVEQKEAQEAAVFMLEGGCLIGPERLSTLGVRAVKEQTSVGSSLFAQPLMLAPVPLDGEAAVEVKDSPEERAKAVLAKLEGRAAQSHVSESRPFDKLRAGYGAPRSVADVALLSDHLSLLRRWYYRPEKQRKGEVFFQNVNHEWPVRRILRGAARMVLGEPAVMAETNREGAADAEVRILHEGREGVERVVPMVKRKGRPRIGADETEKARG